MFKVFQYGNCSEGEQTVYAVREYNGKTQFLMYEYGSWHWNDSSDYFPVD